MMTIGKLAGSAGVNVETVRYYQRIGLLEMPPTTAGYRQYGEAHLQALHFVRRAKDAGFALEEIRELLLLDAVRDRGKIHDLASQRLADLEGRLRDMQALAQRLRSLVARCESENGNGCCPIVETFRQ
ncbi:MAG: MerR family transcriptional regulator [Moraxellaceae bacterium]|jgi:MerR family mercuric resistance operon transcriptional regulator|nr:MerR family transcriptional regulator [Moraxellaceae bacterium]